MINVFRILLIHFVGAACLAIAGFSTEPTVATASNPAQNTETVEVDFSQSIQPLLASRCYACHGPDQAESGLKLTTHEDATAECDSGGFAIVAGDSSSSGMLARITSADEFERMPPEGEPLDDEQIEILTRWIQQGAKFSPHWGFAPITDADIPVASDDAWNANSIDAFIHHDLEKAGLSPAPLANRRTLIRRATYDLTGLPPTMEEIDEFVSNSASDEVAFSQVVDRLLQSPHYGERWGRHWLDLVRYAETNSFERDGPKPNAWRYRDYVIRSFNDDKPYDQFVREQIAGDELDKVTAETLTATGYFRLGIWDDEPADPLQAKFDEFDDLISTTSGAILGLTIQCARCHDHKIDPIPQSDYYSMLAFLADVTSYGQRGNVTGNNQIDVSPPELIHQYESLDRDKRRCRDAMLKMEQVAIAKMPDPDQSCEARFQTLGPNQALAMLNGEWSHQQAAALVDRIKQDHPKQASTFESFVRHTIRYTLGRDTTDDELRGGKTLRNNLIESGVSDRQSRVLFALSVLNWNEFLFLD